MNINQDTDALIVIDMQNDFAYEHGQLAVRDGHQIVNPIGQLCDKFNNLFFTVDYHPVAHKSFASYHSKAPFEVIQMYNHPQVLWPDHCVKGTWGVEIVDALKFYSTMKAKQVIRKGMNSIIDSYSAFYENFGPSGDQATTGFGAMLNALGMKRLFFVGLARDYCVNFSAQDAVADGFEAFVVDDLTKSVNTSNEAIAEINRCFKISNIKLINSGDIK